MDNAITSFTEQYRFLSNFWLTPINYEGMVYPSVEHAYQAAKTSLHHQRVHIAKLLRPGDAKRYARQHICIADMNTWNNTKVDIMYSLLRAKFGVTFNIDTTLRRKLHATAPLTLIEGNTWGDTFWGQCPVGVGENHLGKLLMQVRGE